MENICSNKSIEQEQFAVLGILSKIIQEKGIETAIYRDSSSSFNDSVIQMMCCDFSNKYDFIFDLGEEENKKILEDKNEYENFSATLKKTLAEKLNIDENSIILSIPKKGSAKISVTFATPGVYEENDLESRFKDVKGLKKIHKSVLIEGCKLTNKIFDQKGNNKDPGWGIGEKRGGFDYIPPIGWIGYGLSVKNKYDGGNNDWLSYNHPKNEYAIAYFPIKSYHEDYSEMKKFIGSIANNNVINDNFQSFYDIFADEIDLRSQEKCGSGIYVYQDIEVAEHQASIIDVNGIRYKVLIMCRVNPNKIRIPQNFPKVWIVNQNSFEIRQYRILIKIVVLTPLADKTFVAYSQPKKYYRQIIKKKDLSFFENDKIKEIMKEKNFNKHEAIVKFYTCDEYYRSINNSLIKGKYIKNKELSEKEIESYIWCLHSTLRNYYKDVVSDKLIPVKDGTVLVRRSDRSFDLNKYGIGSQFYLSTFTSTSLNMNSTFPGEHKMIVTIKNNEKNNYCYFIKNVSKYSTEEEVLITAYSNFFIKSVNKNEKGHLIVEIECVGYVLDDDKVEEWPVENENKSSSKCIIF